jgi:hypothetical protein
MTESKTAVILPVFRDITIVAEVKRPEITARDEATTVSGDRVASVCMVTAGVCFVSTWEMV